MFLCTLAIALPFYDRRTSDLSWCDSDLTRCAKSESGVRNRGTQAWVTITADTHILFEFFDHVEKLCFEMYYK